MNPGEHLDNHGITSAFGGPEQGLVRRGKERVVFVINESALEQGAGWQDGNFNIFLPAQKPAPFDSNRTLTELALGLTSAQLALARAFRDGHELHAFEAIDKGLYRYAGQMKLAEDPTLIEPKPGTRTGYRWHVALRPLDGGAARYVRDYVPLGFFAVIFKATSPALEQLALARLGALMGIHLSISHDRTTWPQSLETWPSHACALVTLTDDANLGALLSELDNLSIDHSVEICDQRRVVSNVNNGRILRQLDKFAERKRVNTIKRLRELSKSFRPGAFDADDLFEIDYDSDEVIQLAFDTIGLPDEYDYVVRISSEEAPSPTMLSIPGEDLPISEEEVLRELQTSASIFAPKVRDYSQLQVDEKID